MKLNRWLRFALCAGVLLAACDSKSDADKPTNTGKAGAGADAVGAAAEALRFVGEVADSDARVAVVTGAGKLRLFFCGGADSVAEATHWFNLDIADAGVVAIDAAPWKVNANVDSDGVSGELTRDDGVLRKFSAAPVVEGTLTGLYEGTADCGRLGLIVAQPSKGGPINAQGACVGEGHVPEQVNPILPVAQDNGQIPVMTPGDEAATSLLQAAGLTPL
jgi:hypothetical protein